MDYIPKETPQAASPPPSYELKKDVTGQTPEKRGEQIITDKNGNNVKLPYPPKVKCKQCWGRGYLGTNVKTGRFVICRKCYPIV